MIFVHKFIFIFLIYKCNYVFSEKCKILINEINYNDKDNHENGKFVERRRICDPDNTSQNNTSTNPYQQIFLDYIKLIGNRKRRRREMHTNEPPSFSKLLYIVNVPEEKDKGFVVTSLTANDPENHEVTYSMNAVLDARSQSMFSIDSTSGLVTTTSRLDREFMDVHYLRVMAVDNGIPPKTCTTTLQINVNDENDHAPVFEQASYEASLRESAPIGTTVVTVRATDQDSGPNAEIEYSILNPTGANEAYKIDSRTGMITTRNTLDRETTDFYTLTIQATDSGAVQSRKYSQTTVAIRILDDNDNYPQFSERSYSTQVAEDINWLNHPVIMKVSATDADDGLNAAIRYSIIGGNTQGSFVMDNLNGEITVVSKLDYELTRSYRLVIRAQDAGSPPRSNTTQLLINVVDKNDNEPKFYTTLFQETVMENTPVGTSIIRVQAYDPDDGQNAIISYSIKNAKKPEMPFGIDNETGWIMTTREIDWEESNVYEFSVVAQDQGYPSLSSSSNVIIRIQDVNDNSPVFEQKIYEKTLSEIDAPGSPVITVSATDKDENSRLIFQITSGNLRGRFNIISQNGQGLISIAQPLDYKAEKNFVLTVSATDPGGKSDTATVYINVTDANTHRPIIERTPYAANIPEDTPVGSTILVIEASDADVGENARITFQMDDVPEFKIDPNSGALVTTKALDREVSSGYTIVVTAIDNGVPPLADTTNVEIEVTDVNDNSPEFKQSSYTTAISEDALIGSSVIQIEAFDKDLGLNGQVRYTFNGGNDGSSTFNIDPTSGTVRTNKLLDRETVPKYELIAYAYDRGTPSLSTSVSIVVFLEDTNDNPPRFSSDRIQFNVPENSPVGWIVGELNAIDPDEGPNAKIEYSIVGGADMKSFALKSRPGDDGVELITQTEMDYESDKKKYNLIIRASSLPLRNDVDVEIYVTDVNDHAPILRDFSIVFNNYKSYFPMNRIIGKIPAFDADVADKLHYKFQSGNNANLLILNETTGEIKLSPSLNTNVPMRALFEVNVFDGINEAAATCHLVVNLVTEAMLFHSVTIRLNRITQYSFLSGIFNRFLDGLAAIIPCPKENIVIFNIQDDNEVNSQVLNISFSVRLPESRDTESFYSPQYLQERVYLNRAILTRLTDLEVLPFDDNLCVREPCLNFEECLSVLKFGNASDFIASDTILFRAIHPVNTFACRCPKGFQGMHHKYECDTEINLCFSSPCQNGGTCVHQEGSYVCLCPDGYAGKNCEINFISDLCRSGICKGDSKCVNSRSMKLKATEGGIGGFQCMNCTMAEWSTQLCELKARTFTKGSYLTFSSMRKRYRLDISLRFATRDSNALLFYNGRYNEKHDFIALEIIDSRLVFTFSLGANITEVSIGKYKGTINDGKWHKVQVNYLNRTVILKLDDCDEALLKAIDKKQLEEKYICANKTTLLLESRCEDRMQTCYRFLDLTGPFQIGGLPPLPTNFQISNNQFVGCISDLHIDHQLVDLNSYVANNGTIAGCSQKRDFCHSQPCLNGGTCEEAWGSFTCNCIEGFGGQDCSEANEVVKQFKGDGFLSFTPRLRPLTLPWAVKFLFKTFNSDGLLLKLQLGQNTLILIEIIGGSIMYTYNSQSVVMKNVKVNDGKWHFLDANWMANGIWLNLDYGQYEENKEFVGDIRGLYIAKVTVGGLETNDENAGDVNSPAFNGCIQGLDVGNSKDSWLRPSLEINVFDGCTSIDPCLTRPCPTHSTCINKGLSNFECKCDSGYVGATCKAVCNLNPCSQHAICLPSNSSRGYSCKCDKNYSGIYCQDKLPETCPSNWWGYPICGPCNCDTSKGYDGNCNKTNGECSCEANHFQPLNSDVCFGCDCYSVGSYSNKCDSITGQCICRPGVIGRRCDSCPSPFAEVTLRGCEVIYDGCPKSFSEGVWWERTLFGTTNIQSCPSGSVGKAVRHCDETNGWSTPDLFDCTSNAFIDLSYQLTLMEKEKFPLTSFVSIKIINELRSAVNTTYPLNGNDILITYRLIYHLINNELNQTGLNLTHKQDRLFLRNLVEVTSSILETRYNSHWDRIADILKLGGPEIFLKLYNSYIETLIQHQQDTFTEPFEITSKYMVFGLDTVSTDELWDIPKSLQSFINRTSLIHSSVPSVYLDYSLQDAGPSVIIPKYNNYPIRKHHIDDITRAVIPVKSLGIKTIEEIASNPLLTSHHKSYHNKAQIGYAIFPSLGQLLPGLLDFTVRHRFGVPIKVNTPLFLLTIKPLNSSKYLSKSSIQKLHFRLRTLIREGRNNPQCAYWAFSPTGKQKPGTYSRGRWSTKGCELKGFHPPQSYRLAYDYINCSCDRSIGIGVLMDVTSNEYFVQESLAQVITSYTGIITSLMFLALTYVILTVIRGLETNSNSIHRNLVLSLFFAQLLFLTALRTRNELVLKEFPCKMMAIFLHYFFMCLFSWMLVEGIHLHRMFTEIRDINHGPMRFYYFIGYAVPAIIVGLTVGVRADQYGNYLFCWFSIHESVIWSMVGPICFAAFINLIVFGLALQASVQIKETISDYGNLKTLLWLSIILLPLLGVTWILAMLSVNDSSDELNFGFSAMCIISSIYIFIGYCLINRRVRYNIRVTWWRMQGRKVSYVDESLSGTRTSVASRSIPFHNSSFDIMHRNINICASSTTSRSTITKASSSPYRIDSQMPSSSGINRRNRRHRRRNAHSADSESDSDVSYDRSFDLASSHSSDEDDKSNAPQQNRINSAIQNNLLFASESIFPSMRVSNSEQANIGGNFRGTQNKWSQISPTVVSSSQPSPLTDHGQYLTSRPYSRSNILAMTAGLGDSRATSNEIISQSSKIFGNKDINSLNQFSPPSIDRSSSPSVSNDEILSPSEQLSSAQNNEETIYYQYNINVQDNHDDDHEEVDESEGDQNEKSEEEENCIESQKVDSSHDLPSESE